MIFSLQKKKGRSPSFPSGFCRKQTDSLLQRPLLRVIVHRVRAPSHHVDDDGGHVNLCRLCFGDEGRGCTVATNRVSSPDVTSLLHLRSAPTSCILLPKIYDLWSWIRSQWAAASLTRRLVRKMVLSRADRRSVPSARLARDWGVSACRALPVES